MYSRKTIPIVGRNFAFKAALAVQGANDLRNVDVRNALRFLDVLSRQGHLANEPDINDVIHKIAAHVCQCGVYPPLVSFAQYNIALTNVVRFVQGSSTDLSRAAGTVRHLLSVLAKANKEEVSLYEHGDSTCLSIFVQREFRRGNRAVTGKGWAGVSSYRLPCSA
jgi:hypothetical protein